MQDQSFPGGRRGPQSGRRSDAGVVDFAAWVVGLLAARKAQDPVSLRPDLAERFLAAAIADDPAPLQDFLGELVRLKMPAAVLADLYVPEVARALGEHWLEDRLSFLQVSVGSARLQAILRAVGQAWSADAGAAPGQNGTLLLVTPPHEQHTLGALVLVGQLRRAGVSVRVAIGPNPPELRQIFDICHFDGVLISAACSDRVAELARFVQHIRQSAPGRVTVVVGGAAILRMPELAGLAGADAAATDVAGALGACGLQEGAASARRSA